MAGSLPRPQLGLSQSAGLGLRIPHFDALIDSAENIPWVEIMADNWLSDGGLSAQMLDHLKERLPISVHGVGLSLGSPDPLDLEYLKSIKSLLRRSNAVMYSEHISFSAIDGTFYPDLLPLPFTEEALVLLSSRIAQVQDFLGRQMLIENVSAYVDFAESEVSEGRFIAELVARTGCGVLLDINNLYVNQRNLGRNAWTQITQIPSESIHEIHLAGFSKSGDWLVDTHGSPVCDEVWQLYRQTLERIGPTPTLIEWDTELPSFEVLNAERIKAENILQIFEDVQV